MPDTLTADQIIDLLELEPLPGEGGWFRETYKASGTIPASALPHHGGDRTHSTQIYYLLRAGAASTLHRVTSDEVFHHYMGAPVTQLQLSPEGEARVIKIGPDLARGERPQAVAPAHWWQGALLTSDTTSSPDPNAWALLGCTVSPGFEWADFELIEPDGKVPGLDAARAGHSWVDRLLTPGSGTMP